MQVGELHAAVIHALDRPGSRIPRFGVAAEKKGDLRDFKKTARNEQRVIRLARRFDVDQELSEYISGSPVMQRPSGPLMSGLMEEVRAPFPTMWIEFSAPELPQAMLDVANDLFPNDDNRVVGCLVEDADTHIEFQWFTSNRFHWFGVQYHRDRESHWPQELIDNGEAAQFDTMRDTIAGVCYGMNDCPASMVNVARQTNPILKLMFAPDKQASVSLADMTAVFFGTMTRFVCMLIQTLNFPWVAYDPVMVPSGGKGTLTRLKPHDSYYRARIALPKDHQEMREINPLSEPRHGNRLHQVRGHWRVYRNEDGSFRKRTWVAQHTRGNVKLGVVLKDYQLTYEENA